jgi:hypothetical protein
MAMIGASASCRASSQKLALSYSPALTGLAKLEESQVLGYIAATKLNGNATADAASLDSLLARFQGDYELCKTLLEKVCCQFNGLHRIHAHYRSSRLQIRLDKRVDLSMSCHQMDMNSKSEDTRYFYSRLPAITSDLSPFSVFDNSTNQSIWPW